MDSFFSHDDNTISHVKTLMLSEFGNILHPKDITYIISELAGLSATKQVLSPDITLDSNALANIEAICIKLSNNIPLAYALGFQEFYGRKFLLGKETLIPRPESELIVEITLELIRNYDNKNNQATIVDCGTGSGCIGISILAEYLAKTSHSSLEIILSDIQAKCLEYAHKNALNILGKEIISSSMQFLESNLLSNFPKDKVFNIIIANLPYIASNHMRMLFLDKEPSIALEGSNTPCLYQQNGFSDGLEIIENLFMQSSQLTYTHTLILEADPLQFDSLHSLASQYGYVSMKDIHDIRGYRRVFLCKNSI